MASEGRGDVNLDDGRVAMTVVGLRWITNPSLFKSSHCILVLKYLSISE
jgi:hypothetical protein